MVELIVSGAFDRAYPGADRFVGLSMSRMGYAELSASRMESKHRGVFEMIHDELKARGLALDSEDGVSIRLRPDVRMAYLLLIAQEAREAGRRHGFDLQPTTNGTNARAAVRSFLELTPMPAREQVISFDLATASIDLEGVSLDEVLDFRRQHRGEHRAYLLNLRRFLADISTADRPDRVRLLEQRQAELNEQARTLRSLALRGFKRPANAAGFALGLTGAAWSLATNPVAAGLAALGVAARLLPNRDTGSAYSYIFRAHRQWG